MKIYLQEQKVTLVGKAWQIKYMLKKYMKTYTTVQEWIEVQRPKQSIAPEEKLHSRKNTVKK